jgi:lysophospholipase L1-like esterase
MGLLMKKRVLLGRLFILISTLGSVLGSTAPSVRAQDQWIATWAASPQSPRLVFPRLPTPPPSPSAQPGQPNPPAPPVFPVPPTINNQTVRMVVRTSIGGRRVRIELSNAFGTTPLVVGAAHLALRQKESAIVQGSDRPLTFSGMQSFTIPPAALALSDPVDLDVPKLGDLVISVYIPTEANTPTVHLTALHTTYLSQPGDQTGALSIADPKTVQLWYWISAVYVDAPPKAGLIVAFGDSITDGATSTPDADRSWPSQLAERLVANNLTANVAIVNEGISGNRLLSDGAGVSALARLDRDVLSQPGVKWLIVLEGINDIGISTGFGAQPADAVTADDLIAALKQIIERAHMHGIRVIGATLTPYLGAAYATDQGESIREAVNHWIRTSHAYDAVIDFDVAVADSANPKQIRPAYNIRDHLHPNDDGYKAMAAAVDLSMFSTDTKP